jgi:hypothetical protein
MQEKEKWQNPELIVLVRGRPEEAVLSACKGELPGGYNDQAGACLVGALACDVCEVLGAS